MIPTEDAKGDSYLIRENECKYCKTRLSSELDSWVKVGEEKVKIERWKQNEDRLAKRISLEKHLKVVRSMREQLRRIRAYREAMEKYEAQKDDVPSSFITTDKVD